MLASSLPAIKTFGTHKIEEVKNCAREMPKVLPPMEFSCNSVQLTIQLGVFLKSGELFSLALSCSLKDLNTLQMNIMLV
jgi:hypothetical protein